MRKANNQSLLDNLQRQNEQFRDELHFIGEKMILLDQ